MYMKIVKNLPGSIDLSPWNILTRDSYIHVCHGTIQNMTPYVIGPYIVWWYLGL